MADAVCAGLEAGKVRCWIAPRDVAPGAQWAGSIIRGITEAKIMVVIFSGHTNNSRHVMNEIERAVSHGVTIIPFRIENVAPSEDLELFISSCHWLDALTPPIEAKINELLRAALGVLGRGIPDVNVIGEPARPAAPRYAAKPRHKKIASHPRRRRNPAGRSPDLFLSRRKGPPRCCPWRCSRIPG